MRLLLHVFILACVGFATTVFADDSADLASYLKDAKVTGVGTCDETRSTLVQLKTTEFEEILQFATVSNSHLTFYVFKKNKDDRDTYIYFLKDETNPQVPEISKESAMLWYMRLRTVNTSFLNYVMHPGRSTDCTVSQRL